MLLTFALLCGNLKESRTLLGPIFTAAYYIGMEACMDNIRNFLVRYTTGAGVLRLSPAYYVHMNLLYLAVLGWAVFYYAVLKTHRGALPLRFWIMTVIPPLGSMMLLTGFATEARPLLEMGINIYRQGLLFGFFLTALNLLTFYMYVRLLTFYEANLQTQVLQGQLTAYTRRVTMIEDFQHQAGELQHELKNIIFTMNVDMEQQNYAQVKRRMAELLGDLKQVERECYTGNSLIDAVIAYKAVGLRELGAILSVETDLLDLEPPAAYDIASIMGISLDNVTDAVAFIETQTAHTRAAIHCTIQRQKNMLMIDVTNPLPGPLRYHNGEIRSTKTETGHGLGLPALRRIVQKYAGDVTISDSGHVFSLSITLFV
jgi:hypothetical protein